MKKLSSIVLVFCGLTSFAQTFKTFHDFKQVTITGDTLDLASYAGKKVLVVNTATACGYTPQLGPLQKLDSLYESYGFEVIGFPCNNFANQEPLVDSSINQFCQNNYNVQFQMMHKISIVSGDTAEVYKWLQNANRNGVATKHVVWNFNKFLIDRQGKWVRHFTQGTSPLDTAITNWIKRPEITETNSTIHQSAYTLLANPVNASSTIVCIAEKGRQPVGVQLTDALGRVQTIHWQMENDRLVVVPPYLTPQCYWLKITGIEGSDVLRVLVEK